MLKQLPNRNQRSKGFKVKHFLQICLLIALFFWLFNQLKHSYDTKMSLSHQKISENPHILEQIAKLGRKHLYPRVDVNSRGDKMEMEQEIKGIEDERERAEDEESEEVEDLIDVDDRDRDRDIGNEEQDKSQDDAMLHKSQTVRTEFQTSSLRMIKGNAKYKERETTMLEENLRETN